MPTQIPATPDDTTETAHYPCAHDYGVSPTRTWLYKPESDPEHALTCLRTAELRESEGATSLDDRGAVEREFGRLKHEYVSGSKIRICA